MVTITIELSDEVVAQLINEAQQQNTSLQQFISQNVDKLLSSDDADVTHKQQRKEDVLCPDCKGQHRILRSCSMCGGNGKCNVCKGSGRYDDHYPCTWCNGNTNYRCDGCAGLGSYELEVNCTTCNGYGKISAEVADDLRIKRVAADEEKDRQQIEATHKAEAIKQQQAELKRLQEEEHRYAQEATTKIRIAEEPIRRAAQAKHQAELEKTKRAVAVEEHKKKKRNQVIIGIRFFMLGIVGVSLLLIRHVMNSHDTSSVNNRIDAKQSLLDTSDPALDRYVSITSQRRLTERDLAGLSKSDLTIMRNAPYARHHYQFGQGQSSSPLYDYFHKQSWYVPQTKDIDHTYDTFNSNERTNVKLILDYQTRYHLR